jgi:hypothetical protein
MCCYQYVSVKLEACLHKLEFSTVKLLKKKLDHGKMKSPWLCFKKGRTGPWLTRKLAESSSQRATHILQAPRFEGRWVASSKETVQSEYDWFLEFPNVTEKVS